MNDLVIGPSTGWLYGIDIYSLAAHTHFLRSASSRANAIELPMTGLSCDDKRYSSLAEGKSLNEKEWLVYKSIHLPDYSIEASEVGNIKWLIERHGFNTTLCHPLKQKSEYPVESYELLFRHSVIH